MNEAINSNIFLVKEHVGMFKAANNFDVFDPTTGAQIMICREPHLGFFSKMLRFTDYKRMTPFDIRVTTPEGKPVVSVRRGVSFFLSKVQIFDEADQQIGGFQQKFFSIGGAFDIQDVQGNSICKLKGKWTGWNFQFIANDVAIAQVSKKWAGIGKEMFTSADNYVIEIKETVPAGSPIRQLILAAVFCIDMVLKE